MKQTTKSVCALALLSLSTALASAGEWNTIKKVAPIPVDVYAYSADAFGNPTSGAELVRVTDISRDAPAWQVAFDGNNSNLATLAANAGTYGPTSGLWSLGDDFIGAMVANDMTMPAARARRTAQGFNIQFVWNPNGTVPASGSGNLRILVGCVDKVNGDGGPAYENPLSQLVLIFNALPAGTYSQNYDLSGSASGLGFPLPEATGGGFQLKALESVSPTPLTTQKFQVLFANMCAPGEPDFPGTNPSSSDQFAWVDDTTLSIGSLINKSDYTFADLANTAPLGTAYSERYDEDLTDIAAGYIQPCLGFFTNANARTISGIVKLPEKMAGADWPASADIVVYDGTNRNTVTVALGPNGEYSVLDTLQGGAGGIRRVSIKTRTWLRQNIIVNTAAGSVSGENVSLLGGDCDTNNAVTTDDYLHLSLHFDKDSTDPLWDTVPDPNQPIGPTNLPISYADLDLSGAVTTDDYLILSNNFDVEGDVVP